MLSPENQSWHNALPLPKSSQVFIALLQLSLGFQIFLLKLLSHLQIMLDQTVPLNIRCQMMLNWTEDWREDLQCFGLFVINLRINLRRAFQLKRTSQPSFPRIHLVMLHNTQHRSWHSHLFIKEKENQKG